MKMNRMISFLLVVGVVATLGILAHEVSGFGGRRPVPSAMYYANYENNGYGVDQFAGYDDDITVINPQKGPTPFRYRKWHNRGFEETMGVPAPLFNYRNSVSPRSKTRSERTNPALGQRIFSHGVDASGSWGYGFGGVCPTQKSVCPKEGFSFKGETSNMVGTEFSYVSSVQNETYSQEFIVGDYWNPCYSPCFDPCFSPCVVSCPPMMSSPPKRHCILDGIKKLFCHKKSFCGPSTFTSDPWYSTAPYYTPAWSGGVVYGGYDGYMTGTMMSAPGCCGAGDSGFHSGAITYESGVTSDNGIDSRQPVSQPVSPPTMIQSPAPAGVIPQGTPTNINVPSYPAIPSGVPNPTTVVPGSTGVIRMTVPEDAIVYINGYQTKLTGVERSFTANNLENGEAYDFEIRVVALQEGQAMEQVKYTTLVGGKTAALAFMQYDFNTKIVALR